MKILHTADWHIGKTLYGKKRYEEHTAFLHWLVKAIHDERVSTLLVAGDIFDTCAPSHQAQALYYHFLRQVIDSPCRHVVLIAGNHDSPSFLDAPRELLKSLHVHVVGQAKEDPEEEIVVLYDDKNEPELIVCAVPFLRDRDIRSAEPGESLEEKEEKLRAGICSHYAKVARCAEEKRKELGTDIPIVAMGHLFTQGAKTVEGDGVRELYVGSLAHVSAGIFPDIFDYVALGHLHVPQIVGGCSHIRYSGSPIPMGFHEARQQKGVCLLSCEGRKVSVDILVTPTFQALERIEGCWEEISKRIGELVHEGKKVFVEVIHTADTFLSDLGERLMELTAKTGVEVLRESCSHTKHKVLEGIHALETLDELDEKEVFSRCLQAYNVPDEQKPALFGAHDETLIAFQQD